ALSFIVERYTLNRLATRLNGRPASSSAAIVLANVAGSFDDAIAAISARWSSMPFISAGLNAATLTLSNRGKPPWGPVHGASKGSSVTPSPFANDSLLRNAVSTAAEAAV